MGKGSNRRQFNKRLEDSFKLGHRRTFGPKKESGSTKTIYVVKDKTLILKSERAPC